MTKEELAAAVKRVGPIAKDVEVELKRVPREMDELELIARLGLPDKITTERLIWSKHWRCDCCAMTYKFDRPMAIPAPCDCCGGIAFTAL